VDHHLGALYTARGEHAQAEAAFRTVLEIKTRVLGADPMRSLRWNSTSSGSLGLHGEKENVDRR
jgi:hypothetical protein